jgi:hypothetical protein
LDGFWNMISGEAHQQRNSIRNPNIQVFHSWMCKWILGRMRETKVTDTELNWLYSALIARQPIDPSYLMINRWCCEATSGLGDIGSGCYLSMLSISLRQGIPRNPKHLLTGTSLIASLLSVHCVSPHRRSHKPCRIFTLKTKYLSVF